MSTPKAPADHFTILYFASAASYTRKSFDHVAGPLETKKLFDHLESKYPGMKQKVLDSCAVTVNLDYIDIDEKDDDGRLIQAGDEVAIIPPVSSG